MPVGQRRGKVFIARGSKLLGIDGYSGSLVREYPWSSSIGLQIAEEYAIWGYMKEVATGDLEAGRELWRISMGDDPEGWTTGSQIATSRVVVFGKRGGDIVAVDIKTGREKWRTSVADLTWNMIASETRGGEASGQMHVHDDSVIVNVSNNYLSRLALSNGRRIWTREMRVSETIAMGDRIYVANNTVVDARSGRLISQKWQGVPPEFVRGGIYFTSGFALSDTHGYSCTNNGDIAAWERSTGKIVWWYRPPGACGGFGVKLMIADGRLYWADGSKRLYCLEEVTATDPVLKADREALAAAGAPFKFPRVPVEIREARAMRKTKAKSKSRRKA